MAESAHGREQTEQAHTAGQLKRGGQSRDGDLQAVLGQLEALAARVEEQAGKIAALEAENKQLRASVPPTGQASAPAKPGITTRRRALRRLLGATAAATALAVAKEAGSAQAAAIGTISGASSSSYGILSAPDISAPAVPSGLNGEGLVGVTNAATVAAYPSSSYTNGGFASGVFGSGNNGLGVVGACNSNSGVLGFSPSFRGVFGASTSGIGVEGDSTNSTGVIGRATAAGNPNPGVIGSATNGYGVFGFSQNSNGIAGQSGGGAAGCVGFAGAPGGYGIYGGIAVQGGYAGGFAGPVLVVGNFTATGGAKSAAVPHPDGTHRRLYCMESPESWFEDAADGKLVNGRAQVTLDPDFAAVVHNDKYLIYLTPEGDCKGLYVGSKSTSGFEVRELQGGTSSLSFNYRVMARRKDIPAPRLEKVQLPEPIKELVKPDLPKPAELPRPPEPPKAPAGPERPGR